VGRELETGNGELQAGGWVEVLVAGRRSWALGAGAGGSLRLDAFQGVRALDAGESRALTP